MENVTLIFSLLDFALQIRRHNNNDETLQWGIHKFAGSIIYFLDDVNYTDSFSGIPGIGQNNCMCSCFTGDYKNTSGKMRENNSGWVTFETIAQVIHFDIICLKLFQIFLDIKTNQWWLDNIVKQLYM